MGLRIEGGRVLVGDGLVEAAVAVADGVIASLDGASGVGRTFDATGLWVLPGIVDLHGDAFERQFQPRPGIGFPVEMALRDTEAQLLASGITTAGNSEPCDWWIVIA